MLEQLLGDGWYIKVTSNIQSGKNCESKYYGYHIKKYGLLRYQGRMYIPKEGDLREVILREAHREHYCAHPGVKKMYADMNKLFFWAGMKSDVVDFVSKFLECQQVKVDHRHPAGLYSLMIFLRLNGKSFPWNSLWDFPSHPRDIMLYSWWSTN